MVTMYAYYFHKNILYIRFIFKRFSNEIREKLVCKLLPEHVMIDVALAWGNHNNSDHVLFGGMSIKQNIVYYGNYVCIYYGF